MTRPVVTRLAVAGLIAVLASASLAQGRRPQRLEGTYRTGSSGTVTMRGNTDNVRSAVLELNRDGSFDLRISADKTITVEGRWDDKSSTQAGLIIYEINNQRATGTGMASVDRGGQLDLLNLNGNANGSRFNLLIRSRDTDHGNNGRDRDDWGRNGGSLNATRSGRGQIQYSRGGDDRISEVQVTLERDGDARVRIEGEEDFSFSGRWRGDRSNRVTLDFDQSFGRRANSDGWLVMDGRGGFTELHITGRNPIINQTFRLNFNTNGRGSGWDRDDDRGNYSRQAAGTYTFLDRFTERGDRDTIRYTLRLERDGRAELVAQTNEDLPRDRNSIEEHGEILHRLDGRNQGRHVGTWSSDGNRVTIRLTSFRYGSRSEGEESTFRGTLMNNGSDLRIDEWDRAFYGRDNRFWFDKN